MPSLRRECLAHLIVLDEQHLASVLAECVRYCNRERPHRTLGLQTPARRPRLVPGPIRSRPVLNGLHRVYERVA
jgi:transposase InsO family protein